MDPFRNENRLSYCSEDESEEEENNSLKRKNEYKEEGQLKKRKWEKQSMPRLSTASSASSYESPSNSEGELSPGFYSGNRSMFGMQSSLEDNAEPEENPVQSSFSMKAQKIMMNMGYEKGKGLGKFQQGIVAPISASNQRGRRGLGFTIEGLEPMDNLKWDKSKEHIVIQEEVFWLPLNNSTPPDLKTMLSWAKEGPKKEDLIDETEFCHPQVLQNVLASKSVFDNLSDKELFRARTRCNPFETIGKLFFQNRAALKMANLDTVFDFMFTKPVDENGRSLVGPDELLYFADVCAAPGGFSEYVLWRRKSLSNGFCDAKGFGFTLRENDFKLHDFFAAPSEFFEPHYGVNGNYGDGNIYVPSNISNFRAFVLKSTGGKGVHFMMADGGFSVDGKENIQEILSKQIYLCQFLVALGIVRAGGHFVCKLFDIFTPFSVGLIYIMYRCFKQTSIHKPNSSRPANSERYIICKWKKDDVSDAYEYLYKLNARLNSFDPISNEDIVEVVPLNILKEDNEFYQYICDLNNVFGNRQVVGLQKIKTFCQDPSLYEEQQSTIRRECLTFWHLPDKTRVAPERKEPKTKARELLSPLLLDKLTHGPEDLLLSNLPEKIRSPYDFRFMFLSSPKEVEYKERGFFIGLGGPNVFIWNGKNTNLWKRVTANMNLPPDTIIYGEIVTELRGEVKAQKRVKTLHFIDALVLNGFDVTNLHLVERHQYLMKFANALNKESRNDLLPIRCKNLYKLEDATSVITPPLLAWRAMKGGNNVERRTLLEFEACEDDPACYTIPSGIILMKITQDPWMMAYSKSQKRKYWFNTHTRASTFECQKEVIAPLSVSYCEGCCWWWHPGAQILENEKQEPGNLHLSTLINHINKTK